MLYTVHSPGQPAHAIPIANGDFCVVPSSQRLSIVVPVYNEAETIQPLIEAILKSAPPCRIILVDDGSTDGSGARCDEAAARHAGIDVIHFDANRGKTEALSAGFAQADADIVITMDSDLQDDPAEIPRFLEALDGGLDLVCGWKADRKDPWHKRWASRVFNGFTAMLFGVKLHDINCGFKAMRSEVTKSLCLQHDYHRLIPVLAAAQGYRVGEIKVRHHPRRHGTTKFGFERYWRGLRDVMRLWRELRAQSRGQTP
jgi:glycosyltransferase involved in cell wall biosynthesis